MSIGNANCLLCGASIVYAEDARKLSASRR